jgi:hypothetical protein
MHLSDEKRSKIGDGLLTGVTLILVSFIIIIARRLAHAMFGLSGLLVISLVLAAAAILMIDQSLSNRYRESRRALLGMCGGIITWQVAACAAVMDGIPAAGYGSILLLILVGTILSLLFRRVLPLGLRFFVVTFLLSWIGQLIFGFQSQLAVFPRIFAIVHWGGGILAIGGMIAGLAMIFFRSKTVSHRLYLGLVIWMCAMIALYTFGSAWVTY